MKVSVIIPTLNEESYIGALLDSLHNQTYPILEIFVVDCGSEDNTQAIIRKDHKVKLLKTHKPVGHQRTFGGKKVQGDMLLFLDADVVLDPLFIENSIQEIQNKSLQVACPKYIPYPGSIGIHIFYGWFNILFKIFERISPSGAGSCIFVTKELFEKVQGFDATLTYDDIHFIHRAARKGRFRMLSTKVNVSDRRIRKYGLLFTTVQYMILSLLFVCGAYRLANKMPYSFGIFQKTNYTLSYRAIN